MSGLCVSIALTGGLAIPVKGFFPVFVYTFALLITAPKAVLGGCIAHAQTSRSHNYKH